MTACAQPETPLGGRGRPRRYRSGAPGDREAGSIERARVRRQDPLSRRVRLWSAGRAASFAVVAFAFAFAVSALGAPRPSALVIALLVAAYAVVWRVEFETATGVTVPNVPALVPMFVLLPPGLVPVAAVTRGLLGDVFAAQRCGVAETALAVADALGLEHPAEGARMLAEVGGYLADIGELVRHHHERCDGTGYPDGLIGDAIPLGSRIVCACDAFSAMTTGRSDRAALPVAVVRAETRAAS